MVNIPDKLTGVWMTNKFCYVFTLIQSENPGSAILVGACQVADITRGWDFVVPSAICLCFFISFLIKQPIKCHFMNTKQTLVKNAARYTPIQRKLFNTLIQRKLSKTLMHTCNESRKTSKRLRPYNRLFTVSIIRKTYLLTYVPAHGVLYINIYQETSTRMYTPFLIGFN